MKHTMDCPHCGAPMELGYLSAAGARILWTEKKKRWSSWPQGRDVVLQRGLRVQSDTVAYLCRKCHTVVVKY